MMTVMLRELAHNAKTGPSRRVASENSWNAVLGRPGAGLAG